MENEIWKAIDWIAGFENIYFVSNKGNVKSVDRTHSCGRRIKGRVLKNVLDSDGYHILCFRNAPLKIISKVHRLVATAFIPNPENKPQVNHKDGVKTNNNVLNLEWNTSKENVVHSWENGLSKSNDKSRSWIIKMNSRLVLDTQSGIFYSSGTEAAKTFNLKKSTLLSRLNGNLKNNTNLIYV